MKECDANSFSNFAQRCFAHDEVGVSGNHSQKLRSCSKADNRTTADQTSTLSGDVLLA
jgi:hypothetical protein